MGGHFENRAPRSARMITDIEDYFAKGCGRCERFATADCSTRRWERGLLELRRICRDAGMRETVKWGHPCYMHAGRNIAVVGAFREDFRLSFFHAALLEDPDGALEKSGENTQHADMIRFTDNAEPRRRERVIRSLLAEAAGYAEKGIVPEKVTRVLDVPSELSSALETDDVLAAAWRALTPGRQRSYLFNLNAAKKSATRVARIAKFRDKIIAGKGAMER